MGVLAGALTLDPAEPATVAVPAPDGKIASVVPTEVCAIAPNVMVTELGALIVILLAPLTEVLAKVWLRAAELLPLTYKPPPPSESADVATTMLLAALAALKSRSSVPALTVVVPVNVLLLVRVTVPLPVLVTPPTPEITPPISKELPAAAVRECVDENARFRLIVSRFGELSAIAADDAMELPVSA